MSGIGRTLIFICTAAALSAALQAEPIAIVGARVIDIANAAVLEDAVLVIEPPLIRALGRRGRVAVPDGAAVIDAAGKTLLPGLFDLHVHMGLGEGLEAGGQFYGVERIQRDADRALYFGVMHLASLGFDRDDIFTVRNRQRAGGGSGARLYAAGAGFTAPAGWRPPVPLGPTRAEEWLSIPDAVDEARQMVRRQAARGADFVKIWVDDGGDSGAKLSPDLYGAIIDEAHALGLKVIAHVIELDDSKELLRRGVDAFAHAVRDRSVDAEFLELAAGKNVAQMATLASARYQLDYGAGTAHYLDDREVARALPPAWIAALKSSAHRDRLAASAEENTREREIVADNVARSARAGVPIVVGTDAGGSPGAFHGLAVHLELEELVAAGLTPAEALQAATLNSARFLGLDHLYGSLAAGKVADFIVLAADPLDDIANTRTIEAVWMNGRAVDRDSVARSVLR